MDNPPPVSESTDEANEQPVVAPLFKASQHAVSAIRLFGPAEQLLPVLFAFTEAGWIAALLLGFALIHFLDWSQPLIPLWAPFLIIPVISWVSFVLQRSHIQRYRQLPARAQSLCLIGLQTFLTLLVLWDSLFATSIPLWDLHWLLTLIQNVVQMNVQAFSTLGIILLCYYFFYRGTAIAARTPEPDQITRMMQLGSLIFIGVICAQAATGEQDIRLLFLLPLFLCSALFTRSLSHIIFVRHQHVMGSTRRTVTQDRLLITTVVPICLLLLCIAFVVGLLADPNLLTQMQVLLAPLGFVYDALTTVLAAIATILLAPFVLLLNGSKFQAPSIHIPTSPVNTKLSPHLKQTSPAVIALTNILTMLVILAMIIGIILLIRLALRIYKKKQQSQLDDQHESLWSWALLWQQIKQLCFSLWQWIFRRRTTPSLQPNIIKEGDQQEEPNSIRAIYRAFLRWAASYGYVRRRNETPYEFQHRIAQPLKHFEPALQVVTAVYTLERYSEEQSSEADIAYMHYNWNVLQQQAPLSENPATHHDDQR